MLKLNNAYVTVYIHVLCCDRRPVAAAVVSDETKESFDFIFSHLLKAGNNRCPDVIFTDADQAAAASIETIFPSTTFHFRCLWHLSKNISQFAARHLGTHPQRESFMKGFFKCRNCLTPVMFSEQWNEFFNSWCTEGEGKSIF